jgi:hypothetical protein
MPPVAAHAEDAFAIRRPNRRPAFDTPARRKRSSFPWLRLCLGSGAVTAALVVLARQPEPAVFDGPERPVIDEAPLRAPPPLWQPIAQPTALFALDLPELQGLPFAYEARRDSDDAREDALTFGTADADARPYGRLIMHQVPQSEGQGLSFFVDFARRAADAGLAVGRSALASGVPTKFGLAEAADVALSGGVERAGRSAAQPAPARLHDRRCLPPRRRCGAPGCVRAGRAATGPHVRPARPSRRGSKTGSLRPQRPPPVIHESGTLSVAHASSSEMFLSSLTLAV